MAVQRVTHGSPEDKWCVSDTHRRCATCGEEKRVQLFFRKSDKTTTIDCRECLESRKLANYEKQAKSRGAQ